MIKIPAYTQKRVTKQLQKGINVDIVNKVKFTAGRIADFKCPDDKDQFFLWDSETPGLAIRATKGSDVKRYIFQSKVKSKTIRITIGKISVWSIAKAQDEARRLQVEIDRGNDPRIQAAEKEAADEAKLKSLKEEADALALKDKVESIKAIEAWNVYVAERLKATKKGKPVWGASTIKHHAYLLQKGGEVRKSGRHPNDPETTRQGMLVDLMAMRLIDITDKVIEAWIEKEAAQAPTSTSKAFTALRAFLTWCSRHNIYKHAIQPETWATDGIKNKLPANKTKPNDCLRRAQVKPWFDAVRKINNPVISAYTQCLLLTGARRNELTGLRWKDVDFQWKSITMRDKVEDERTIPLTPYMEHLITSLPRRNQYVFSSPTSASGRLEEPRKAHNNAVDRASLPDLSLHGLRRSFSTLAEWVEVPAGIVAQIMGHKPSAIAEKHYIQRELDLLALWHTRIESWILNEAGIKFEPVKAGLRAVDAG